MAFDIQTESSLSSSAASAITIICSCHCHQVQIESRQGSAYQCWRSSFKNVSIQCSLRKFVTRPQLSLTHACVLPDDANAQCHGTTCLTRSSCIVEFQVDSKFFRLHWLNGSGVTFSIGRVHCRTVIYLHTLWSRKGGDVSALFDLYQHIGEILISVAIYSSLKYPLHSSSLIPARRAVRPWA